MKLKTERTLLKNWIREQKKTNPLIEEDMMTVLRISRSTWTKIMYLEGYCPNTQTRMLLAKQTGISEDRLFPSVEDVKEVA